MDNKRKVVRMLASTAVTDGDGVSINRSITGGSLVDTDPFLLLDEIRSDDPRCYIGGFPEHPHRGFETVTYMLKGAMKHSDHLGNEGVLNEGDVQWMTAGRGVLHAEMPLQKNGLLHGFQLWINLAANEKMQPANYREYPATTIPEVSLASQGHARVIAGTFTYQGTSTHGPVTGVSVDPEYVDIALNRHHSFTLTTHSKKRLLLYVYQGSMNIESTQLNTQTLGILSMGDSVTIQANEDCRFLWLAGLPLNQPIAQWGPFVMNTQQEIRQAIADYRQGKLVI